MAIGTEEQRQLKRVLQFDSPKPQTVWFRALTGEIAQESDRVFRSGRLRLTIPTTETKLRSLPDEPKRSELLLRLQLPQGKSTLEFIYEPLNEDSHLRLRLPADSDCRCHDVLVCTRAEEVGQRWGTEEREREYYPIVNIPLPPDTVIEAGAFAVLPDGRMAVGTRHGEIYLIDGVDAAKPTPSFHLFASGMDEIFGLDLERQCVSRHSKLRIDSCQRFKQRRRRRSL